MGDISLFVMGGNYGVNDRLVGAIVLGSVQISDGALEGDQGVASTVFGFTLNRSVKSKKNS